MAKSDKRPARSERGGRPASAGRGAGRGGGTRAGSGTGAAGGGGKARTGRDGRKARSPRPGSRARRPRGRGFLRAVGWRVAFAGLVILAGYTAWLDVRVRAEFEDKRWALPARVYARPTEIWPGARLDPAAFENELAHSGYHREDRLTRPGSYARDGGRFVIRAREFRFWDSVEPARRIGVELDSRGVVRALATDGRAAALARLDPPLIGRIYPGHHEDRVMLRLVEAPPVLIAGLVAVEDHRFFEHHGISFLAIARAGWANLRAGGVVQGGSTLTQQLAKNFFLSSERTLWRKGTEALMAVLLDLHYTKEELLEAYLNEIYLGQEGRRAIHGFGLASWFYFGRRIDELDLAETALLIGLARGASAYSPRRRPERALRRRDLVLDVMVGRGVVRRAEADAAKARPLGIRPEAPRGASPHPAFIDLVRRQLSRDYRDVDLRTAGLRIFTTLDPDVQGRAERLLARELDAAERRRGLPPGILQGAAFLARAEDGEVLAVVGDRRARARGFNRALDARRPIGSLVKPALFLAALERGYSLASPVEDAPVSIKLATGRKWTPRNHDGDHLGAMPLYRALALSRNAAAARLGLAIGVRRVTGVLERLGIAGPIRPLPSLLLGSLELSPFQVAQMYQPLANEGFRAPLRSIREVTGPAGRRSHVMACPSSRSQSRPTSTCCGRRSRPRCERVPGAARAPGFRPPCTRRARRGRRAAGAIAGSPDSPVATSRWCGSATTTTGRPG